MTRCLLTLLVLLFLPATTVHACSCTEPPPPLDAMKDATAVFTGRVVAAIPYGTNAYTYTLRVYAVWKGSAAPEAIVATSDVAMCGLWMRPGTEYLVYATGPEDELFTSNCSRSKPTSLAAPDFAELGAPIAVGTTDASVAMLKARFE